MSATRKPLKCRLGGLLDGLRGVPVNWMFRGRERDLTYHDRRGENTGGRPARGGCAFAGGVFGRGGGGGRRVLFAGWAPKAPGRGDPGLGYWRRAGTRSRSGQH